jgi:hypothetical protein
VLISDQGRNTHLLLLYSSQRVLLIKVGVMPGASNGHILCSSWIYTTTCNMFKKFFTSVECNGGHEKFRSYELLVAVVCAMQFYIFML